MSVHLTESEKIDYILQGVTALPTAKRLHLEGCADCRQEIKDQVSVDHLLGKLIPLKPNVAVYDRIMPHLQKQSAIKKRDWFFVITLVTLVIIAFSFIFQDNKPSGFTGKLILTPVTKLLDQKTPDINFEWKNFIETGFRGLTGFFINQLGENPSARLLLVIMLVILFYLILDHDILRRRKIQPKIIENRINE